MSDASYTLQALFKEAGLEAIPDWSKHIKMPFKPYQHQIGDLNFLAQSARSGLFNEPGVGKTLSMQSYSLWLASQGNKVAFVMPPVLVDQFLASFSRTFPNHQAFVSSDA